MKGKTDRMETEKSIGKAEKIIGYEFKNKELLKKALCHSSYSNEQKNGLQSNERLEFLGDSVLSLIAAQFLFFEHKNLPEGELTKARSSLVCEQALYIYAKKIELGKHLLLGKGEELTGGRERPSLLADAFEALLAAIYLDGGLLQARGFMLPFISEYEPKRLFKDHKTILQEIIQKTPGDILSYKEAGEQGPEHDKLFMSEVYLNSKKIGAGSGKSKKDAQQAAAGDALRKMGYNE